MVQYSDRGRDSGDRDYRDRYRPNDDRAGEFEDRKGDGGDRHHERGANSSFEWATLGLRRGVPTGNP